jgi:hypothetical protein
VIHLVAVALAVPVAMIGPAGASLATAGAAVPATARAVPASKPGPGWSLTRDSRGVRLVWRSPTPHTGDARVDFFSGTRRLGIPRSADDGRTFSLVVPPGAVADPGDLQVRAGGRRLDAADPDAERAQAPRTRAATTVPPAEVDPGILGQFSTVTGEYSLPDVTLPGLSTPVEMKAVVVAPRGAGDNQPLALFLHGRHITCFGDPDENDLLSWPCPAGSTAVPSYRGYLDEQRLLASQGYVTVSVSANGINARDDALVDGGAQARSSLVRLHLARWADWAGPGRAAAPAVVRQAPRADLSNVLLVGHSRGGEGVDRAATDSLNRPPAAIDGYSGPVRWTVRGTVQLAPSVYGRNPAADVPSAVVMGGCDGDVFYQEGQGQVDGTRASSTGTALHSVVYVVGADHNYFNTEWTPGLSTGPAADDWALSFGDDDPLCGTAGSVSATSVRLSAAEQRQVASVYIATAAAVFVKRDVRALPLLDGSTVRAPSAGSARVLTHAVGAGRHRLVLPSADLGVTGSTSTTARLCRPVSDGTDSCQGPDPTLVVPSFVTFWPVTQEPDQYAVDLDWSAAGGGGARLVPAKPASLSGDRFVSLRVIVPPNSRNRFDVRVADGAGRRVTLGQVAVDGLPGTDLTVSSWVQEVRVPLSAAWSAGLDVGRITELALVPRTATGQAYLLDAWGYQPTLPVPQPAVRARIDVGELGQVTETDAGRTLQMPVTVSGAGSGQVRLFTVDQATSRTTSRLVTVTAGTTHLGVPITVPGDTAYSAPTTWSVLAEAGPGTVVGDFEGDLTVVDDDPAPTLTATPVVEHVSEGQSLSWRFDLSAAAASDVTVELTFVAPPTGDELSSTDVPSAWYESTTGRYELPSEPLSVGTFTGYVTIPAGTTSFDFEMPTVVDDLVEPSESVRFELGTVDGSPRSEPLVLTGTVTD